MKYYALYNPNAGNGDSESRARAISDMFPEEVCYFDVTKHNYTELLSGIDTNDVIIICGGDGTLSETVTGMMSLPPEKRIPIGFIPAGSTNDVARTIGIPMGNIKKAARFIVSGDNFHHDVGSFGGDRYFTYVASFGAFTRVSYSAPQSIKNELGHLAYLLEGVKDISSLRPYPATVITEDEVFTGRFLFGAITNATSVGGLMRLKEDTVILDDGKFELLLIPTPTNPLELQALIRSLLLQDYSSGVIFRHVSKVTVKSPEAFPWTLDGEYGSGAEEVEICNLRQKLHMLL